LILRTNTGKRVCEWRGRAITLASASPDLYAPRR
jgi:hypothetical protein